MSVTLPTTSLAGVVAGQTGNVDFTPLGFTSDPSFYNNPAHVQIFNESHVGLNLLFTTSGNSTFIPAGGWRTIPIQPGEAGYQWQAVYTIGNPGVTSLITVGYAPGETVPPVGALGNSPVNTNVTASSAFDLLSGDSTRFFYVDNTSFPNTLDLTPAVAPSNGTQTLDVGLAAKLGGDTTTYRRVLYSDVVNNTLHMAMAVQFELNTGFSLAGMQVLSGSGPGTPSHSLGVTPQIAICSPTNSAQAAGVGSYTSTNVTIFIAAGQAWKCLLIA